MRTTATLLAYALALAFGTYHTFRPTFDSRFVRVQTERGDGMLNHLILENSWLALTDPNYKGTLLSPPMYHPERYTLLYSENLFASAPIYWALRAVMSHDLAYIWWQIGCGALNFVSFAVVARWLRLSHALAVAGAFLWGFAVVHADQIKHSQMIPRFFAPFAAYYAIQLVTEPAQKAKALSRMLGALFFQCLACVYSGWFLAVGLAVFLPTLLYLRRDRARELWAYVRANRRRVAGVLALWGFAMLALFGPYILVNLGVSRTYADCHNLFPTPAAWVTAPAGTRWHQTLDAVRHPEPFECMLFSGLGLYALFFAACVHLPLVPRASRPAVWPVAAASLFTALVWVLLTLTTSQEGESLWRIVRLIPGGGAIRVVTRVYVIVYLFGTIGILLWLQWLLDRVPQPATRTAVLVPLLALLAWEQTGFEQESFERRDFYPYVDQIADELRGAEAGYVVPRYVDGKEKVSVGPYGEVFAMWAGMRANVPVLNGYSGRGPRDFPQPPTGALSDDDIREWLRGKFRGTVRVIDSEAPGQARYIVIE